VSFYCYFWYFG